MKYGYLVRQNPKCQWRAGKHYPMTKKQANEAIKGEQLESKIVEWNRILRMQGIEPKHY